MQSDVLSYSSGNHTVGSSLVVQTHPSAILPWVLLSSCGCLSRLGLRHYLCGQIEQATLKPKLTLPRIQVFSPQCLSLASTNVGEGLVKVMTSNDVPGCVEEWDIPAVQL